MVCLFCKKDTANVIQLRLFQVMCASCEARGPLRETAEAAKSSWGRKMAALDRVERVKEPMTENEKMYYDMCKLSLQVKQGTPSTKLASEQIGVHPNMIPRYRKSLVKKGWIRCSKDGKRVIQIFK